MQRQRQHQRWIHAIVFFLLIFFVAAPFTVKAQTENSSFLVSVNRSVQNPEQFLKTLIQQRLGSARIERLDRSGKQKLSAALDHTFRVLVKNDQIASFKTLSKVQGIRYVENNGFVKAAMTPTDPNYSSQWHLLTLGMETVWDYDATTPLYGGDPSVIVAVLDTGAAYENFTDHGTVYAQAPDFAQTTFASGYDFVNGDSHPNDDNGHGTHVTSTIAEGTNNSIAGAGVAFNTSIMPVKILNASGVGTISDVVQGIDYATDHGAKIINLSLGSPTDSQTLHDAVQRALDAGILVVAAVGNEASTAISYPAAYTGVLAVSAVGKTNVLASYANHGKGVGIVAPGGDNGDYIWQQTFSNLDANHLPKDFTTFGMVGYQGTSQAAPQVSGIAALLLAYGVPATQVLSLLETTATDLGVAGYDTSYGYGLVNPGAAFASVINDVVAPTSSLAIAPTTPDGLRGYYKTSPTITVSASDPDPGSGVKTIYYFLDAGALTTYTKPFTVPDGIHTLSFYAVDTAGNIEAPQTKSLQIDASPPIVHLTSPSGTVSTRKITISGTIADTISGVKILLVDGVTTPVADDGTFQTTLGIHEGKNLVLFRSSNNAGAVTDTTIPITLSRSPLTIVAPNQGGSPQIRTYSLSAKLVSQFLAYGKSFQGGVHAETADLNGDGNDEIITAPASSGGPQVRIFDGNGKLLGQFLAYDANFHGGVNLARGLNNRGGAEKILTVQASEAPAEVKVFDAKGKRGAHFFPNKTEPTLKVLATSADLEGKGASSIATYAPEKSTGNIKVWTQAGKILTSATLGSTASMSSKFFNEGFFQKGTHATLLSGTLDQSKGTVIGFGSSGKISSKIGPILSLPKNGFTATVRYQP